MPDEPKIEISETNPGEEPIDRSGMALKADLKLRFNEPPMLRSKLIEFIKNARELPILDQAYILARIDLIPAKHDILTFSLICVPHKAGFNFNFTICEVGG